MKRAIYNYDYIFLCSAYDRYIGRIPNAEYYVKMEEKYARLCYKALSDEKYIVKQHPAKKEGLKELPTETKSSCPTEIQYIFSNLNKKVFFAIYSVALYN